MIQIKQMHSVQIAIFVLPVMVLVGWAIGKPFLLDLEPFAALVLTLSVIHTYFVSSDGNSNWCAIPGQHAVCKGLPLSACMAQATK